jgi:putative transposase
MCCSKNKNNKDKEGDDKKEYTPERRISRGLYKSSCGIVNADINAARNIGGIRGEEGLREVEIAVYC